MRRSLSIYANNIREVSVEGGLQSEDGQLLTTCEILAEVCSAFCGIDLGTVVGHVPGARAKVRRETHGTG